jgi:hypothetical protein
LIRQLISILLICAVLTGHLSVAVPHSHAGMAPSEQAVYDNIPHVHVGRHSHSGHSHANHSHANHSHSNHSHSGDAPNRFTTFKSAIAGDASDSCDGFPRETLPEGSEHGVPIYLALAVIGNSFQLPSVRVLSISGELQPWAVFFARSEWGVLDFPWDGGLVHERPPERLRYGISVFLLTRRLRL